MSELILALDASSTHVGYCLARGESYIESGVFVPGPHDDARLRVRKIVAFIANYLNDKAPEIVVIEEPMGSHGNLKTDRLLAWTCGAIDATAQLMRVKTIELIHPLAVKRTGFSKDHAGAAACLVNKRSVGPDEADAIGIWQAYLCRAQEAQYAYESDQKQTPRRRRNR